MARLPVPADPLAPLIEEIRRRLKPELDAELIALKDELLREFKIERQLLYAAEAAKYLGIAAERFATLAKAGEIPHKTINGRRRYFIPDLNDWAARQPSGEVR